MGHSTADKIHSPKRFVGLDPKHVDYSVGGRGLYAYKIKLHIIHQGQFASSTKHFGFFYLGGGGGGWEKGGLCSNTSFLMNDTFFTTHSGSGNKEVNAACKLRADYSRTSSSL